MTRDGERAKDTREALDAALAGARDVSSEELLVDAVRRLLTSDRVVLDEAARWVREHG